MVQWVPKLILMMFCAPAVLVLQDTAGVHRKPLELHDQKAAVFVFVGIDCPISNSYGPEINRLIKANKDKGLAFYIVYSDSTATMDATRTHAKAYGYRCPALIDDQQKLMKKLKATVTPEAVVIDGKGSVLYRGRIDNWYEELGKQRFSVTQHYLQNALDEVIAGKKVTTPETKTVGCPI